MLNNLPEKLVKLNCASNNIISLTNLPAMLELLNCSNNNIVNATVQLSNATVVSINAKGIIPAITSTAPNCIRPSPLSKVLL